MKTLTEQLSSAIIQVGVVFGLCCFVYGLVWLVSRRRLAGQSLMRYLGLVRTSGQVDRVFLWILAAIIM